MNQPLCIARMQTDRGLIQHIQRTDQTATQRFRQIDALTLTAGKRGALPVQRQITQSHIFHELQPAADLLKQNLCCLLFDIGQLQMREPFVQLVYRHRA